MDLLLTLQHKLSKSFHVLFFFFFSLNMVIILSTFILFCLPFFSSSCSKRHIVNVSSIQRNLMSSYDNQKNITIASTSTCQASNPYSNMTQSDINKGNFYCYDIIKYLHEHILFIITSFSNFVLQSTYI